MSSIIPAVFPLVLLFSAMGMLSQIGSSHAIAGELQRKLLHISIGLTALSFPLFLKESWTVIAALGLVVVWLIAVRQIPLLQRYFGSVLQKVRRNSLGEIYYALAIAFLLLLTPDRPILFLIPILILALADAFAAIVGTVFPIGRFSGIARGKTVAGCVTFFVVAFLTSFGVLVAFADLQIADAFIIATVLAAATCVVEAISRRGIDNLVVPATAYLILFFSNVPGDAGTAHIARLHFELNTLMAGL